MTCCLPDRAVSLSVWWSLPDDNDAETGGRYRPPVIIWPNGFSSRAADAMRSHDVAKLHGPLRTCLARAGRPDHSSFLAGDGWTDRWFRRCITLSGTVGAVRPERLGCEGGIGFCLAVCSPVAAPIGGGAIAEPVPVCRCRSWFEWRVSCRTGHDHSPGGFLISEPAGRALQIGAGESNLRAIEPPWQAIRACIPADADESPTESHELWDQTTGTGWKAPEIDLGDGGTLVPEYP